MRAHAFMLCSKQCRNHAWGLRRPRYKGMRGGRPVAPDAKHVLRSHVILLRNAADEGHCRAIVVEALKPAALTPGRVYSIFIGAQCRRIRLAPIGDEGSVLIQKFDA